VITTIWNEVTFEKLQGVFAEWIQRVIWVIEHGRSITLNGCCSFLKEFSLVEKSRGGQDVLDLDNRPDGDSNWSGAVKAPDTQTATKGYRESTLSVR
jgi:hypothetical protein